MSYWGAPGWFGWLSAQLLILTQAMISGLEDGAYLGFPHTTLPPPPTCLLSLKKKTTEKENEVWTVSLPVGFID